MQDPSFPDNPNTLGEQLKRKARVAWAATWGFLSGLGESAWNLNKQMPWAAPIRMAEVILDKDPSRNLLEKAGYVVTPQGHALATVAGNRYAFLVDQKGFDPGEAVPCVVAAALGDVLGPTPFLEGVLDFDFSYNIGQELSWDDQALRIYNGGTSMFLTVAGMGRGPAPRGSGTARARIRPPGPEFLPEVAVPGGPRNILKVKLVGERIEVRKLNWRERRQVGTDRHLMNMRTFGEDFNWLEDRVITSGKQGALTALGSKQALCGLSPFCCTEGTAARLVQSLPGVRVLKILGSKSPCPACQARLAAAASLAKIVILYEELGKNIWAFVPRPLPIRPK